MKKAKNTTPGITPAPKVAASPSLHLSPPLSPVAIALLLLMIGVLTVAAYVRNGIYQSHVTLWASVTERSPNKRRAHENYGQALSTAGSLARSQADAKMLYEEALRQFQTVMSLKDDGSVPPRDLYREIGVVQFRMARYDAAIESWKTGLRFSPNDPSLLNNLSIVLMQQGRFDEAAAHAQSALAVNPSMPQALNTMGQVYMMKKEYEKAMEFFLKAIEREPDVPARYWNAALAMSQAGKQKMALQYANQYAAIERDPAGRQRAMQFIQYLKKQQSE